jgi:hypothetical protein
MNGQADIMKLIVHFCKFGNAPKNYIFILMVNFSIDSLEIWCRFKKLKITFVWKHVYSVIINGCPEERIRASFSIMVRDTQERLIAKDFFINFMAKLLSDPSDAFLFARTTFSKPSSVKILIG